MAVTATMAGRCPVCGEQIRKGDLIVKDRVYDRGAVAEQWVHDDCELPAGVPRGSDAKADICPRCFLLRPCECDDDDLRQEAVR